MDYSTVCNDCYLMFDILSMMYLNQLIEQFKYQYYVLCMCVFLEKSDPCYIFK